MDCIPNADSQESPGEYNRRCGIFQVFAAIGEKSSQSATPRSCGYRVLMKIGRCAARDNPESHRSVLLGHVGSYEYAVEGFNVALMLN